MLKLVWATDIDLNFVSVATAAAWCRSVEQLQAGAVLISGDIAEAPTLLAGCASWRIGSAPRSISWPATTITIGAALRPFAQTWPTSRPRQIGSAGSTRWSGALTEQTGLIGHGGWADGRKRGSRTVHPDDERPRPDPRFPRVESVRACADYWRDWATRRQSTSVGCCRWRSIGLSNTLLLTHVPPFPEAAWHEGHPGMPMGCRTSPARLFGDGLLDLMRDRPDRRLTVLCGHTTVRASLATTEPARQDGRGGLREAGCAARRC